MFKETGNLKRLIFYLREHSYKNVPSMLFDRYLWFYNELEEWQYSLIYEPKQPEIHFYESTRDGHCLAIAAALPRGDTLQVKVDGLENACVHELLQLLSTQFNEKQISITVCNPRLAAYVAQTLSSEVSPGKVKYYTCQGSPLTDLPVKEMGIEDGPYPTQWKYYRQYLAMGERIFGLFVDGKVRSMCGLIQLTCHQAQIISVETFDVADRGKGYARLVSAYALREGLKDAPVVTWSTSLQNIASCRTAEALGMKPYYALYEINAVL